VREVYDDALPFLSGSVLSARWFIVRFPSFTVMKSQPHLLRGWFSACLSMSLSLVTMMHFHSHAQEAGTDRLPDAAAVLKKAEKLHKQGNHKEAYDLLTPLLHGNERVKDAKIVSSIMVAAHEASRALGQAGPNIDEFLATTIAAHSDNWRVLQHAANFLSQSGSQGSMVDGKYVRDRWDGQRAQSIERDRVQMLLWMHRAGELALQDPQATAEDRSHLLLEEARHWLGDRAAWQLQSLTDLTQVPQIEIVEGGRGRGFAPWRSQNDGSTGYPVDAEGNIVFFKVPESWQAAVNDGERWRYLLQRAANTDPASAPSVALSLAERLTQWFDVTTLQGTPVWTSLGAQQQGDSPDQQTLAKQSILDLPSLKENETITQLATGIKRHTLPEEFSYLAIFKELSSADTLVGLRALQHRAQIFENRRQRDVAAALWQEVQDRFGNDKNFRHHHQASSRLQQLRGNLGKLEAGEPQPAGKAAVLDLVFRNSPSVKLEARPIRVDKLMDAVREELRERSKGRAVSGNREWNWLTQAFGSILQGNLDIKKRHIDDFVEKPVAEWEQPLQPLAKHADRRITIETPIHNAGVYLITASFPDGNTTRCLLEVVDLIAITKPRSDAPGQLGLVLDALTGKPIAQAQVNAFGYRQEYRNNNNINNNRPQHLWLISEQQQHSDEKGAFILSSDDERPYQWLVEVKAPDGRRAVLGLHHFYRNQQADEYEDYQQQKVFVTTDRPVYRPNQKVHLSAWARRATYQQDKDGNEYAGRGFEAEITDPRGERYFSQSGILDDQGGADLSLMLADNAALGPYNIHVRIQGMANHGYLTFRVEEYKKPEFEVIVNTPDKPVLLGEAFNATVEARYYFGGAVTNAQVHYKVERTQHVTSWFPVRPWDWLYGPGYWWRNSEYDWLPGFRRCIPYWPVWWPRQVDPPEVVAEATVPIGADGKVQIPIDTALAKELHGNQDHRYQITAEVVDSSRRMIVGRGSVIAPREPYQVYVWTNRGFHQAGEEATVSVTARTPDGKPVSGQASLRIFSITYQQDQQPVEKEVARFDIQAGGDSAATQTLQFPQAGQYRLAVEFDDGAGHKVEGTSHVSVRGQGFEGKDFRFPDLEVIAEKAEYHPGEIARFVINTEQLGGTVLVFERPRFGAYTQPKTLTIADGKSTTFTLPITSADQPNIFLEVLTVRNARVHSKVVQIPVPPAKRIAEVELTPSQNTYKPQAGGKVQIRVTNAAGEPIQGRVLLTGYDKAIEYISGGSNIPAVRDFFWGWKREHHASTILSLNSVYPQIHDEGLQWQPVGQFGRDDQLYFSSVGGGRLRSHQRMVADGFNRMAVAEAAPVPMAAAAPADRGGAMLMKSKSATDSGDSEGTPEAAPMIRQEFADLLTWNASIKTDADGLASVPLDFPDDLTTWKLRAWSLGPNSEVGEAEVEIVTRKELLVRLQAPRFFVEKDEVVLSGIVHNDLKETQNVRAVLELDGMTMAVMDPANIEQRFSIPSGGEHRFDWRVKALSEGDSVVRIKALAKDESDAVEKTYPVLVHGMERQEAWSLALRADQAEGKITFKVPGKRRPAQTRLEVRYSPSLASAMIDALPFLISYPHGCTEQTLNRFVPTVITQRVLNDLGLDLKVIRDKRINFNAQEMGDPIRRASQWQRWKDQDPVFDEEELKKMTVAGIERLESMQANDGGWGWWPGAREGTLHLTAQVVQGLIQAKNAGADVPEETLSGGLQWLLRHEKEQLRRLQLPDKHRDYKSHPDNGDALAHGVLVAAGMGEPAMRNRLYEDRLKLSKFMQAVAGLAFHQSNEMERRDMVIRNLEQYQKIDEENQSAWLDFGHDHQWWYWHDDEVETLAAYLQLRIARDAKDPVASSLVKYLINNRKHGTYWRSTRDTAAVINALATYIKVSGESNADMVVEVWMDGKKLKEAPINQENLFTYDHVLVLEGDELSSGEHQLEVRRKGGGSLYANVYLNCFTLEDHLPAAGLEVKVQRNLYKLIPEDAKDLVAGSRGQALTQKGQRYRREALPENASVNSGDLIEVELIAESKNDYEYLMLEDFKPAGCEAVDLQSGYVWDQGLNAYREFRDEKVSYYVERLPRGKHSLNYRLRAEVPGRFSALPTVISGMYAPELKGNAEEREVAITDSKH
jgi:uncharacterized protein YfaS (alpha-2-macroglobulin family)